MLCYKLKFANAGLSKQGNLQVPIFLEYDGSILDGNSSLEVYDCKDFGDESCGYCKYKKTQGYKCDWCGSCKYSKQETCSSSKKKCSVSISKLEPSSGPIFGGTLVSLEGKNVGNQGDDITVTISGAECTNVTVVKSSKKISCITGNATGRSIGIKVTVNGETYTAANIKYTYVGQHEIFGFSPNRSIIAGGKKIRISGNNLIFPGSDYEIYYCNDSNSCLQCRLSKKYVKNQYMMCRMERSSSILTLKYLKIIIDKNTVRFLLFLKVEDQR
ncbi:unnamed protein product [Mytilus edulis]|uniref:IPT/TIG domain-containing protein n=1 Tax=Mytilus edulis TaxID=6550 RepID=A0A8S3R6I9_MYTED|nr:unnamed protein product [Mytilus edulis]